MEALPPASWGSFGKTPNSPWLSLLTPGSDLQWIHPHSLHTIPTQANPMASNCKHL